MVTTCSVWDVVDNVAVGWIPGQNVTMALPVYHIRGSLTRTIPSNMHLILGTVLHVCALPSSLGLKMRLVDGEKRDVIDQELLASPEQTNPGEELFETAE